MSKIISYKQWTKQEDQFLIQHYKSHGQQYCADKLVRSRSSIRCHAIKKLKIKHTKEETHKKQLTYRKPAGKYTVDETFFTKLNTPEAIYILGFLWADGCLSCKPTIDGMFKFATNLTILQKDMNEVLPMIKKSGTWSECKFLTKQNTPCMAVTSANYYLGKFLYEMGYDQKSTISPDKLLIAIPPKLRCFWWRGYFDGDGCFCINTKRRHIINCSLTFHSTFEQDWNFITLLEHETGENFHIRRSYQKVDFNKSGVKKFSTCKISGSKKCLKVLNYIYSDRLDIGLSRKLEKFKELIHSLNRNIISIGNLDSYWTTPPKEYVNIVNKYLKLIN